tara:strand:- start:2681 stop:3595 length:915 start_codon:yes stop_codon:yes gene_type:complete
MLFNSKDIIGVPTSLGLGASPSYVPVTSPIGDATNAWALYDLYGNGNNIVQLYDSNSSPTTKDFTYSELTGSTYSNWVSGQALVTKIYDQKGGADFLTSSYTVAPYYDSSDNTLDVRVFQYYGMQMATNGNTAVSNAYSNNDTTSVTLVMSLANGEQNFGNSKRTLFGLKESHQYTSHYNVDHRYLVTGNNTYNPVLGMSMKSDSMGAVDEYSNTPQWQSEMYTVCGITRNEQVSGIVRTGIDMTKNSTEILNTTNDVLSTTMTNDRFYFGNGAVFKTSVMMSFDKELTTSEQSALHTDLSSNY